MQTNRSSSWWLNPLALWALFCAVVLHTFEVIVWLDELYRPGTRFLSLTGAWFGISMAQWIHALLWIIILMVVRAWGMPGYYDDAGIYKPMYQSSHFNAAIYTFFYVFFANLMAWITVLNIDSQFTNAEIREWRVHDNSVDPTRNVISAENMWGFARLVGIVCFLLALLTVGKFVRNWLEGTKAERKTSRQETVTDTSPLVQTEL